MKRIVMMFGILALALPFLAVGDAYAAPAKYDVAVGSLGGTMGRLGAGLSEIVNRKQKKVILSVVPGGGRANPARVGGGGADFGYTFSNFAGAAMAGTTPFKKSYKSLRGIASFWPSCYHQYAAKELYDAGVKTWGDIIKSKTPLKVGVAKKGTSTEYVGSLIVKHYKTNYKQLRERGYKLNFAGVNGMSRAIKARQLDFYFHNSGDPNGAGIQAALGRNLVFLDMSDDVKKMLAGHGFTSCQIPGGMYRGNPKPKDSMGLFGVLLTTTKMSADVVYSILKIASQERKFLGGVHKIYKRWDPKKAGMHLGVPLHDGAKRFYKEIGGSM